MGLGGQSSTDGLETALDHTQRLLGENPFLAARGPLGRDIPCGQCRIRPYALVIKPQTIGMRIGCAY